MRRLPWLLLGVAAALQCHKLQPRFDTIPPYTGLPGPFGTVCEVRSAADLPAIPLPAPAAAWGVRSRFPDTFMEVINTSVLLAPRRALSAGDVACGNYTVKRAGAVMDEKVFGLHGGWETWEMGCQECGRALEPSIGPGWYCQTDGSPRTATGVWLKRDQSPSVASVTIDTSAQRQTILGFGGAFTDAVAAAQRQLPSELQAVWQRLYFGADSAGYSVARVPMGGCDFSESEYSLDDLPAGQEDLPLERMCLRDETDVCGRDQKVAMVQEAMAREAEIKLFLSPWSAPAWMKSSGKLTGGTLKGIDGGQTQYVDAWVSTYLKFLDLWKARNVSFWGLTIQNEPGADQFVGWNSMALSGKQESVLLNKLGPLLRERHPALKLMVHDDQVYALHSRLDSSGLLSSPYVDGVAYHWYGTSAGSYENTSAITVGPLTIPVGGGLQVREVYRAHIQGNSGKFMLATEACNGYLVGVLHALTDKDSESNNRGVRPGDWYRGYRYSKDIFYQLANGASGWVDWNLLLRHDGGPNWAKNNVDAPVLVGSDNRSLWVSPMYFQLAHWARYVPAGSVALEVEQPQEGVRVAGFLRPDQRVAVVVLCDQLDGWGDKPPNQQLDVIVRKPNGQDLVTTRVDVISGSITTLIL